MHSSTPSPKPYEQPKPYHPIATPILSGISSSSSSPSTSHGSFNSDGLPAAPARTKVSRTVAKDHSAPAPRENSLLSPGTPPQPSLSVPAIHSSDERKKSPERREPNDYLVPRKDALDRPIRHVSSTNIFATLQTQYSTGSSTGSSTPKSVSSSAPSSLSENSFNQPPTIDIHCENYLQMRKLRAYLQEAKTKFQITKDEAVLLKIFTEKFGKVGDSVPIVFDDDFDGSISWQWQKGKEWIPYLEDEQQQLELAYQREDQSVTIPLPKQRDLLRRESLTGALKVDIKKLIQTNTLNQATHNVRRNISTIFIEGFLLKESSKLKSLKLVYAVLGHRDLSLFTEDKTHLLQLIPLDAIISVKPIYSHPGKEDFIFVVESWKGVAKGYQFSVQSANIMKKWIYHLDLARKKLLLKKAKDIFVGKPTCANNTIVARYSICFCSISTAAYKFPLDEASTIACKVFSDFLNKHPTAPITIYLVDREPESETIKLFKSKQPPDPRFIVRCANLVKLQTEASSPCWYIVNASNPKFSEGGSGTNEAIHDACRSSFTPPLQTLTRKMHGDNADLSAAYEVPLPEGCPLREREDVRWVIHVVGPNMNPKRPNYIGDDPAKGQDALRNCYSNVLNKFWELTGLID